MSRLPGEIFARRLREYRLHLGLSQAWLAEYLTERLDYEVASSAISRMESHGRAVRLDEAVLLAEALGVPLTTLLGEEDSREARLARLHRDYEGYGMRMREAMDAHERARQAAVETKKEIDELEAGGSSED